MTVLNLFLAAADAYGVPSRLRGDHGVENLYVAVWMEEYRGTRRGSYIWGRCVDVDSILRSLTVDTSLTGAFTMCE